MIFKTSDLICLAEPLECIINACADLIDFCQGIAKIGKGGHNNSNHLFFSHISVNNCIL